MYLLFKKTSILVASTKMLGIKTKGSLCFENGNVRKNIAHS